MAYVLKKDCNIDGVKSLYWHRRKKVWCSYWNTGSVYPTHKGAVRICKRLAMTNSGEWIHIVSL